jgi:hypothetical protein
MTRRVLSIVFDLVIGAFIVWLWFVVFTRSLVLWH